MVRVVEDKQYGDDYAFHLAGVIPLCGQQYRGKELPWHPGLLPLTEDTTLIEQAIVQCAWAGCETIWVVVDDSFAPFLKKRCGEYIEDPLYYGQNEYSPIPGVRNRKIPIFYVPEDLFNRDRRDSVSYQVIRGMEMARKVTGQISAFVTPDRYFVTFPYGVYSQFELRSFRSTLSKFDELIFQCDGKSIQTGHYMPFLISLKSAKLCKENVWHTATGAKDVSQPKEEWQFGKFPTALLPLEERYNGRWYGPDQVFNLFIKEFGDNQIDLKWFFDVSTFDGYREYLRSENYIYDTSSLLFKKKTWNSMSFDDDEFGDE